MKSCLNIKPLPALGVSCLFPSHFVYSIYRPKVRSVFGSRYYSSSTSDSELPDLPLPIFTLNNLNKIDIKSYIKLLKDKGGIYSFINVENGNQYIGSAKDFYLRLNEHLGNKKSNVALQNAFSKYGLDKFKFCIYEYFTFESKILSSKALTDLETSYISKFNFNTLYNFKATATSSLGYKHTDEARLKMVEYYKDKSNHPMFGKTHTEEALALISKPGELNPMFGKEHKETTKAIMSLKKNKYPFPPSSSRRWRGSQSEGVGIYDLENNLLYKFKNNVELAKHLNISKVTVGKYLNSGLVYNKTYQFKPIQD